MFTRLPRSPAIASSSSSSTKLSTTKQPISASSASAISSGVLLLPWKWIRFAGNPALSAVCSSPPETTSSDSPSCSATAQIAIVQNALLAYATWKGTPVSRNASMNSRIRCRTSVSSMI